jgi:hypothetical protein
MFSGEAVVVDQNFAVPASPIELRIISLATKQGLE